MKRDGDGRVVTKLPFMQLRQATSIRHVLCKLSLNREMDKHNFWNKWEGNSHTYLKKQRRSRLDLRRIGWSQSGESERLAQQIEKSNNHKACEVAPVIISSLRLWRGKGSLTAAQRSRVNNTSHFRRIIGADCPATTGCSTRRRRRGRRTRRTRRRWRRRNQVQ